MPILKSLFIDTYIVWLFSLHPAAIKSRHKEAKRKNKINLPDNDRQVKNKRRKKINKTQQERERQVVCGMAAIILTYNYWYDYFVILNYNTSLICCWYFPLFINFPFNKMNNNNNNIKTKILLLLFIIFHYFIMAFENNSCRMKIRL